MVPRLPNDQHTTDAQSEYPSKRFEAQIRILMCLLALSIKIAGQFFPQTSIISKMKEKKLSI